MTRPLLEHPDPSTPVQRLLFAPGQDALAALDRLLLAAELVGARELLAPLERVRDEVLQELQQAIGRRGD